MTQMTPSTAIVKGLIENNVDTVFGLPGAQMYDLFDAFYHHQDQIRVIGARHEQALGYMAFGYARSTGKLGVFSPVPGPGVLNTTAALCTAYGTCSPVLCLTGEVPSEFKGQGRGHLHELPDQLGIIKGLTKWATHVDDISETTTLLNHAMSEAQSRRPGPVSLQVCWDHLGQSADIELPSLVKTSPPPKLNNLEIAKAVQLIKEAKAPLIFVGSGAQDASQEVTELAEMMDIPAVGFRGGRGVVGEDRDMGLNIAAARKLWEECDLMIGIGSRMEIPFLRWGKFMNYLREIPGKKLLRIDIDPLEMEKLDVNAPIIGDSSEAVQALIAALKSENIPSTGRLDIIKSAKIKAAKEIEEIQPHVDYLKVIRKILPRDGFLVEEVCQTGFAATYGFPVYEPRTFVSCGYQGNLGFGFPTALGVKVGNPDKTVISITGDGGFMFGVQELATAVQYNISLVTIVFNNSAYGNVRRDQIQRYEGHVIGSDLTNPDFVKLAESFGMDGFLVESPEELQLALEKAVSLNKPALIEVRQVRGAGSSPWKYLLEEMT